MFKPGRRPHPTADRLPLEADIFIPMGFQWTFYRTAIMSMLRQEMQMLFPDFHGINNREDIIKQDPSVDISHYNPEYPVLVTDP
jgi:hypothetical protein